MSGFHLIGFVLSIATLIITLSYLGSSFKAPASIDPTDWKRKWIIFFAWFNLVSMGIFFFLSTGIVVGYRLKSRFR